MLCTGIPELQSVEDIDWLRDAFQLQLNDDEAGSFFYKKILESLNTKTTQINDVIHVWVHSK
jgi:phosphatidylinositol-4,5-bisphosphate 3-kinase